MTTAHKYLGAQSSDLPMTSELEHCVLRTLSSAEDISLRVILVNFFQKVFAHAPTKHYSC
jgi:hypothetical protein